MRFTRKHNLKKKIILFNPPLYFSQGAPRALDVSVPPLGLLYLASYINECSKSVRAKIVDIAVEKISLERMAAVIKKERPLIVGISSMTSQLQGAVELAHFLKQNFGSIKIILGGSHISADLNFLSRHKDIFDYGITGEAEITLLESLEKMVSGKNVPRLQVGRVVADLDTLPFPDRNLIKRERYGQRESMMFSRGCPYHCYYCSRPAISHLIRYRSAKNLIKEIRLNYRYCHGMIDFQDDTFTLSRERVLDFCDRIEKEKLKLDWRCNTRIDLVDEELLLAMKRAGCSLIHFGIEAGNEKIRKEVVKKGQFTNERVYEVIRWCKKRGIKFAGYFIIGHPCEGKRELEQTKEMILNSGIDLLGLSIPTPFPGSELYEIARQRGVIDEEIIDRFARKELGEGYAGNYPVFISEKVSQEYLFSLMKGINRRFYVNFKTLFRKFKDDFLSPQRLYLDFRDLAALILGGISSRKPYISKKVML